MSESLCGRRQSKVDVDRQKSCPEQSSFRYPSTHHSCSHHILDDTYSKRNICSINDQAASNNNKGAGKRFARRAKRWAELQQRRQFARLQREHQEGRYYEVVELMNLGRGAICLDDGPDPHAPLIGGRRSSQYTPLQTRQSEVPFYSPYVDSQQPVCVNRGFNEYGPATLISIFHDDPETAAHSNAPLHSEVWPAPNEDCGNIRPLSHITPWMSDVLPSFSDSGCPLYTSISSQNSTASSESDDVFTFPVSTTSACHCSSGKSCKVILNVTNIPPLNNTNKRTRCVSFPQQHRKPTDIRTATECPLFTIPARVNTAPPPDRTWMMIRHADPERPIATFTVLCYNVLCDKYATAAQYSYCPSWALNWEYRKTAILKEIRNYEADIITLQEVETEQYRMLFQPELKALGYLSIFSPKSRAKTMNEEDRKYVDGCAIFWKADKFDIEREQLIEFTQVAIQKAQQSDHMLNRVMPKDNIALCAVLRVKESVYNNRRVSMNANDNVVGTPLIVCTAHIHWDPEFCDVKLVQCMMFASELEHLLNEVADKFRVSPQQTPVLVCGDFNSLPDSGVFEFLSKGSISRQHSDLKQFKNDPCLERFSAGKDPQIYSHALRLDSAVDNSAVPFTNYTLDFKGVIDYIFSTPQSLARLGVLGPFDMSWIMQNKIIGFPHPHVPSDHIPIMAQYALIPTSHQRTPHHQGGGGSTLASMNHLSHSFGQLGFR